MFYAVVMSLGVFVNIGIAAYQYGWAHDTLAAIYFLLWSVSFELSANRAWDKLK